MLEAVCQYLYYKLRFTNRRACARARAPARSVSTRLRRSHGDSLRRLCAQRRLPGVPDRARAWIGAAHGSELPGLLVRRVRAGTAFASVCTNTRVRLKQAAEYALLASLPQLPSVLREIRRVCCHLGHLLLQPGQLLAALQQLVPVLRHRRGDVVRGLLLRRATGSSVLLLDRVCGPRQLEHVPAATGATPSRDAGGAGERAQSPCLSSSAAREDEAADDVVAGGREDDAAGLLVTNSARSWSGDSGLRMSDCGGHA